MSFCCGARTLVPRRGGQVGADVGLGDEGQAGVGLRRDHQATGEVEQVQGQHRQEALQVRLLVDGEVQAARLDPRQRVRGQVEPAGRPPCRSGRTWRRSAPTVWVEPASTAKMPLRVACGPARRR